jgi:sodium/potassium-transporting ATPase subunit alpha
MSQIPHSQLQEEGGSTDREVDEHLLTAQEVASRYGTRLDEESPASSEGIDAQRVGELKALYGSNEFAPPMIHSPLIMYLKKLMSLLNIMLIIAGVLSYILYIIDTNVDDNLYLGSILITVSLANAFIDFYQEYKTEELLKSFMKLIPEAATVIRGGSFLQVPAGDLVPGDLIQLRNGCKIPADIRLISVQGNMKVDNSSLTGEAEPQERSLKSTHKKPEEAQNLIFKGTMLVSGEGYGIVIRTGSNTLLGKVIGLTVGEKKRESRMTIEIEKFVRKLAGFAFILAGCLFIYGLAKGFTVAVNFSFAIGMFTAFVPQGLPATVTMLLSIAAKKMVTKNALVKDLQGVETLGAVTILCSDKTGTLTQNKMSVVGAWVNSTVLSAYEPFHEFYEHDLPSIGDYKSVPNLQDILRICALCSNARFEESDKEKRSKDRVAYGDATEVGLLRYASKRMNVFSLPNKYPKVFEIPFSSETKYHLTIHRYQHPLGIYQIFLKGAPERVLGLCSYININNHEVKISPEILEKFNTAYEFYASQGHRVLGFASLYLPSDRYPEGYAFGSDPVNFPTSGLIFRGFLSLRDPPKKGVKSAVVSLRHAGIQVSMVTGDHHLTALAIARQVGIVTGRTKEQVAKELEKPVDMVENYEYDVMLVKGDELDAFTKERWREVFAKDEIVFARTLPHQKLKIVKMAQEYGHIVAVSGDGVNDAPALKSADLGISMNKTAADVSKEAAGMILLDDNFATIVEGVREGRLIFTNLKKSIRYTMTHIFPEALPFMIFIIWGIPPMISSFMILLIDLCSELVPAISLAWEEPEGDLMSYPPRKTIIHPEALELDKEMENALPFLPRFLRKARRAIMGDPNMEVLVDNELLAWSLFQAGVIQFLGSCAAFFLQAYWDGLDVSKLENSGDCFLEYKDQVCDFKHTREERPMNKQEQIYAIQAAQTAFYFGIVMNQWFTLLVVKRKYGYPIGSHLLRNKVSMFGVALSMVFAVLISYVPTSHVILSSYHVTMGMLPPLVSGVMLILYEYIRKYLLNKGFFGGFPSKVPIRQVLMNLRSFDAGNGGGSVGVLSRQSSILGEIDRSHHYEKNKNSAFHNSHQIERNTDTEAQAESKGKRE